MYSRYHKPSDTPIQLPENYGGVAFSETPAFKSDVAPPFHPLEVAKPSPPPPSETHTAWSSALRHPSRK